MSNRKIHLRFPALPSGLASYPRVVLTRRPDLLEVTGLRPIRRYLDGTVRPPEPFRPAGPFLWVRHPVELSFLLAFWAAPIMTRGHLLFAALMTLYTFIGIDHEDRRMLDLHGAAYADYMKRVPQILPLFR